MKTVYALEKCEKGLLHRDFTLLPITLKASFPQISVSFGPPILMLSWKKPTEKFPSEVLALRPRLPYCQIEIMEIKGNLYFKNAYLTCYPKSNTLTRDWVNISGIQNSKVLGKGIKELALFKLCIFPREFCLLSRLSCLGLNICCEINVFELTDAMATGCRSPLLGEKTNFMGLPSYALSVKPGHRGHF